MFEPLAGTSGYAVTANQFRGAPESYYYRALSGLLALSELYQIDFRQGLQPHPSAPAFGAVLAAHQQRRARGSKDLSPSEAALAGHTGTSNVDYDTLRRRGRDPALSKKQESRHGPPSADEERPEFVPAVATSSRGRFMTTTSGAMESDAVLQQGQQAPTSGVRAVEL